MTDPGRPPRRDLLRRAASRLVRRFPEPMRSEVGPELVDALVRRIARTRAAAGRGAAFQAALREFWDLFRAGTEARRECARATRLRGTLPRPNGAHTTDRVAEAARDALREATRAFGRRPGETTGLVVLLGLGIGVPTATFTVANEVLRRPPPFPEAHELVHVWNRRPRQEVDRGLWSDSQIDALETALAGTARVSALRMVSGRILGGTSPVHTDVGRVSADFFDILGVEPYLGRLFMAGEDRVGAEWVTVLEYDYWQREFGGDPSVIGRSVVVGWPDMTVVGVLPPDFRFEIPPELGAHGPPDLWIPWWHRPEVDARSNGGTLALVGRLDEGVPPTALQEALERWGEEEDRSHYAESGFTAYSEPLLAAWTRQVGAPIRVVAVGALLVFVLAVANGGALVLIRSRRRAAELSLRRALGASPGRIGRLLSLECLSILSLAWLSTALVTLATLRVVTRFSPSALDAHLTTPLDAPGLVTASGLVILVAAVLTPLALLPHRRAPGGRAETIRRGRHASPGSRPSVPLQVALSTLLLVFAALMGRSAASLERDSLGIDPTERLSFSIYLMDEYDSHESRVAFYDELRHQLVAQDGVATASGTSALPLSGAAPRVLVSDRPTERRIDPRAFFLTEGFSSTHATDPASTTGVMAGVVAAHPGYFETVGTEVEGREFTRDDRTETELVAIVDRRLAAAIGRPDPLGGRLWLAGAFRRVVGVIDPIRMVDPRREQSPMAYLPYTQVQSGRVSMVVRPAGSFETDTLVGEIRDAVAAIDPEVPIGDVRWMESDVSEARALDRFAALILSIFALTAVVLAGTGLYGAVTGAVAERRREIAVRRAIGSGDRHLVVSLLGGTIVRVVTGLAVGLTLAVAADGFVRPILYSVDPRDLVTYSTVAIVVLLITAGATIGPVARALRIDAMATLRTE